MMLVRDLVYLQVMYSMQGEHPYSYFAVPTSQSFQVDSVVPQTGRRSTCLQHLGHAEVMLLGQDRGQGLGRVHPQMSWFIADDA